MVNSYLSLVQRHLGEVLDPEVGEFITFARDGAQQMDRLIRDLLEYSRVGRHGADPERLDLAELVAEANGYLAPLAEDSGATVVIHAVPAAVTGNRSELVRLFQNLIGNALKYRAPDRPPLVEVDWRRDGGEWLVSISDNGIGISPEYRQDIFKIFRRLHSSRDYEGTGIGLAVCQKVVANHNGRIWVESRPGEGSVFHLTLPEAAEIGAT
jgi:signal transduction histidine kinase